MALDFLARQEFRLALRALYLASLAYLGQRELIFIHRSKSNWDGQNEIGPESIDAFVANLDRMRACSGIAIERSAPSPYCWPPVSSPERYNYFD